MVRSSENATALGRFAIAVPVLALPLLMAGGALCAAAGPLTGQEPQAVACEKCHGDHEFLSGFVATPGEQAALYVPDSILAGTRHEQLTCTVCHTTYGEGYPHVGQTVTLPCQGCHQQEGADWAASIHAVEEAEEDAPTCVGCHGGPRPHEIYSADDRRAPTHPLNVTASCSRCHADPGIIGSYFGSAEEAQARVAVDQYYRNVHGVALARAGLAISAACNDCHGSHKILPGSDPESTVHHDNVVDTCGNCHIGIIEVYAAGSAHGSAYLAHEPGSNDVLAPSCVDCHTSHQMTHADDPEWFLGISAMCGNCHEHLWETYLDTYHGQVTDLGFGLTAKCSDCHTAHNMRPASDRSSTVYPMNLVDTCGRCHPDANLNFVKYYAHGDTHDRQHYPLLFWPWLLMTTLLISVWAFFGAHSMMWFCGVAIERALRRRGKGGHHS
jgi:hypothetical protein